MRIACIDATKMEAAATCAAITRESAQTLLSCALASYDALSLIHSDVPALVVLMVGVEGKGRERA